MFTFRKKSNSHWQICVQKHGTIREGKMKSTVTADIKKGLVPLMWKEHWADLPSNPEHAFLPLNPLCSLLKSKAGFAELTWSKERPSLTECSVSSDSCELLPPYCTISELSILLAVTRNCLKLWKNCPHHSQLMSQVGPAILKPFSFSVEVPVTRKCFSVGRPLGSRKRNVEGPIFYSKNWFPLVYLYVISVM